MVWGFFFVWMFLVWLVLVFVGFFGGFFGFLFFVKSRNKTVPQEKSNLEFGLKEKFLHMFWTWNSGGGCEIVMIFRGDIAQRIYGAIFPHWIHERLVVDFSEIWILLWTITRFTEFPFCGKVWLRSFSKILHILSKTPTQQQTHFPLALPRSWSHTRVKALKSYCCIAIAILNVV